MNSDATIEFVVTTNGTAVQLLNPHKSGGNLRFSFATQLGRTHTIQTRTNLATGAWEPLTNFVGDGSVFEWTVGTTNPPIRFFRVGTQ